MVNLFSNVCCCKQTINQSFCKMGKFLYSTWPIWLTKNPILMLWMLLMAIMVFRTLIFVTCIKTVEYDEDWSYKLNYDFKSPRDYDTKQLEYTPPRINQSEQHSVSSILNQTCFGLYFNKQSSTLRICIFSLYFSFKCICRQKVLSYSKTFMFWRTCNQHQLSCHLPFPHF